MIHLYSRYLWNGVAAFALMLSSALAENGQAPAFPSSPIDARLLKDLESRSNSLMQTIDSIPVDEAGKTKQEDVPQSDAAKSRALWEIRRVLYHREMLISGTSVIPSDPFHRANFEYNHALAEFKLAYVWWQYCKGERFLGSLCQWRRLELLAKLNHRIQFAQNVMNELDHRIEIESEPGIAILAPGIADRLPNVGGSRVSVLDRIPDWNQLTDEEKSQIIHR